MAQDIQQVLNDQGLDSAKNHAENMQQFEAFDRQFPPEIIDETNALAYIQSLKLDVELSKQNYVAFSNTGQITFTEGSKQFNQDRKGL
jgi:hypothetical protein